MLGNKEETLKKLFPHSKVNINGEIFDSHEAKISIFDRGFLYGDSIYETFPVYKRKPLFLDNHLERLFHSASLLSLDMSLTREEITGEMLKTIEASPLENQYLRIIITRAESSIGLGKSATPENNLVIISKELPPNPTWWYEDGVSLYVSSVQRNDPRATDPNAKSGNYLNNVMAHIDAQKHNFYDAIMINSEGFVAEGTTFNLWMIKDGIVKTPSPNVGLLKGITRERVIELIKADPQMKFEEAQITAAEFENTDEAFLTSSLRGVVPITQINQTMLSKGVGPLTKTIMNKYKNLVESYLKK